MSLCDANAGDGRDTCLPCADVDVIITLMSDNLLYFGGNLDLLRRHVNDDPGASGMAKREVTREMRLEIKVFEDKWLWDRAAVATSRGSAEAGGRVAQAMQAFRTFLGENPGAPGFANLANMASRLVELRRVLGPTGSNGGGNES